MEITFYWKWFPSNKSDDQQENVIFISGVFFFYDADLFFIMNRGQSLGRTGEFRFFTLTVNKPLKYIKPIVTAELVTYTLCGFFLIEA